MHQRGAALDAQVRAAHDLRQARRAGRGQPDRIAGGDPLADLLGEHVDAPVEVFGRPRFEHERIHRARQPRHVARFDSAGDGQHAPRRKPFGVVVQARIGGDDVGQQRFADLIVAHVQFTGVDPGHECLVAARAFLVEAAFDRLEHPRLLEHEQRFRMQVIDDRGALVVRQAEPRLGNIGAAGEIRAQRRDHVRLAVRAFEHALAQRLVAQDLEPRCDLDGFERRPRALRLHLELPDRVDLVAEELDTDRQIRGRRKDIEDSAAHRVFPGRADDIDARVAEPVQPLKCRVPVRRVTALQAEERR